MIDYRLAQRIVLARAHSFGLEALPLELAYGRVLAEVVRADRDYPPFNRAMVDGFAVRFSDLEAGIRRFEVVATVYAGDSFQGAIRSGECYKIMTGAAVPGDADLVIRREDVEEMEMAMQIRAGVGAGVGARTGTGDGARIGAGDGVNVGAGVRGWKPGLAIARRGEDLGSGEIVIGRPCRCEPAIMGLLASLGKTVVTVQRLPAVALLTTGNEVVAADVPVSGVQIRNSNRWMLEAALKKMGIGIAVHGHAQDDRDLLKKKLEQILAHDIVIISGGVSAGDADYVPEVLTGLGAQTLFHKIAIRPGKPVWCGRTASGGMIFALPGNPFSCLVNFVLLIRPYIEACWGLPPAEPLGLPLEIPRAKKISLDEFFPVRVHGSPARLTPIAINGSGDIRMGMLANGLALHPAGAGDLPAGAELLCYSFT
jgi:molybdopterin molybdotransferase